MEGRSRRLEADSYREPLAIGVAADRRYVYCRS